MYDSCTGILAEGQHTLGCYIGITQELQCHILIVLTCFRVGKHFGHLQVMLTTQHELYIMETLLCQQGQRLLANLQNLVTLKLTYTHTFLCQEAVFGLVLAHLEHWGILEFSHYYIYYLTIYNLQFIYYWDIYSP